MNSNKDTNNHKIETPVRGIAISVQQLADLWDMRATTIRGYIAEGMPVYKQGGKGVSHLLSSEDCARWRIKREVTETLTKFKDQNPSIPAGSSDRLREIRIERAELELAERRGDLFHIGDWVPLIEEVLVSTNDNLSTSLRNCVWNLAICPVP